MQIRSDEMVFAAICAVLAIVLFSTTPGPLAEGASADPSPAEAPASWQDETDPFRRCAKKALAGEFGELQDWQEAAYRWGLAQGVTVQGYAKTTSYGFKWENEDGQNEWTASGSRVHTAGCAANPELEYGTIIWTPRGLRYVFDRGGAVDLQHTNGREIANLDYYTETPMPTLHNAPYAVVKENGDRSVWHRQQGELQ